MRKTLKLLKRGFMSSCGVTNEWKSFYLVMRGEMQSELNEIGAEDFRLSRGHFYVSGFFRVEEQWYYFGISDVRHFNSNRMLIRTAEHNKDYTGGANEMIKIETGMFSKYFRKMSGILTKYEV